MKTARELHDFTMEQKPQIVASILGGVREVLIKHSERDALRGATYYSIHLKDGYYFIKDLLLEESIKLLKEFEDNGYKVSIDDNGNGYYVNFILTISWNGEVRNSKSYHGNNSLIVPDKHLYDTDNGVIGEQS